MFDYSVGLLILAVLLVLIFTAPFFGALFFRGRFGNGQHDGSYFQLKQVKLPWVTVALLAADFIFRCPSLGILAVGTVPLAYRLRMRKTRPEATSNNDKRP